MANVIIPNQERRADAEFIMKSYGVDRNNSAMREAANPQSYAPLFEHLRTVAVPISSDLYSFLPAVV